MSAGCRRFHDREPTRSALACRICAARTHTLDVKLLDPNGTCEKPDFVFDPSKLARDSTLLLGQMLLSKFQLELMRREAVPQHQREAFYVYADEFQTFAGVSQGTWRELLSRGRRYGLALTLANQYPSQLPKVLQDEIFGNVASFIALTLSAKDAQAARREFLEFQTDGTAAPASAESVVSLETGHAIARLDGGAYALPVQCEVPFEDLDRTRGDRVRHASWSRLGMKRAVAQTLRSPRANRSPDVERGEEDELLD